jgi:hypothetical protein
MTFATGSAPAGQSLPSEISARQSLPCDHGRETGGDQGTMPCWRFRSPIDARWRGTVGQHDSQTKKPAERARKPAPIAAAPTAMSGAANRAHHACEPRGRAKSARTIRCGIDHTIWYAGMVRAWCENGLSRFRKRRGVSCGTTLPLSCCTTEASSRASPPRLFHRSPPRCFTASCSAADKALRNRLGSPLASICTFP